MRTCVIPLKLRWFALILLGCVFLYHPVDALAISNLLWDAPSKTARMQEVLPVPVKIHTETDVKVIGADVWIIYDPAYFDIQNYDEGTFFSTVVEPKMTTEGRIYVGGMFDDVTSAKSGDGVIATLNFVPKKTGTTQLKYDCRGNTVNDTSKINVDFSNPQNIIDCSSTAANILTVTIGDTSTGTTPTPTGGAGGTGGTGVASPTPVTYVPGDTTLTPTPSVLPDSGFFDNTLYYALSGGFMVGVGEILRRLYSRSF